MMLFGLLCVTLFCGIIAQPYGGSGYSNKQPYNQQGSYKQQKPQSYNNAQYAPDCDPYYWFRLPDGSCNNLNVTTWGQSMRKYKRLIEPAYDDGKSAPRAKSVDGTKLKSPREIANVIHYPENLLAEITNLFTVFGQFVMHDLTEIYTVKGSDGQNIKCTCESKNKDCLKISIPKDDYYFKDKKCFVQIRGKAAKEESYENNGQYPVRDILNTINSWLDLSNTYGNNLKAENELRAFYGGRLTVAYFKNSAGSLLPSACPANKFKLLDNVCFNSGDDRVNQYPILTSIHTMWVREHNRIADALWKINPHWDDERVFQEAKRINGAIYQNIIYWEWLPWLIGRDVQKVFDLAPSPYGTYFTEYDPTIFPNVAIEFGGAAARYGHAITRSYVTKADENYVTTYNETIKEMMWNPELVIPDYSIDQYVLGMIKDSAYHNPPHVNNELMNWLIVNQGNDNPTQFYSLPAMNINRGRECGIAPYIYYRKLAGLNIPRAFEELDGISSQITKGLQYVYKYVEDIDLYTGGSSEAPVKGGIVGPTFAWILASGFKDWKYGDRWFYENSPQISPYAFTLQQLDSIRQVRFSSVICNNVYAKQIPYDVFIKANPDYNPFISCNDVWQLDLELFREYPQSYAQKNYSPY